MFVFWAQPAGRNGDATADCLGRGILLRVPLGCRLGLGMRWFTTKNDYSNAHTSRTSSN